MVSFVPPGDAAETAARLYELGVVIRSLPARGVTVLLVLCYMGMETPLHVHNGVLVKIPIWTKHPVSSPPRVIDGVFRGGFRHQMNSWG